MVQRDTQEFLAAVAVGAALGAVAVLVLVPRLGGSARRGRVGSRPAALRRCGRGPTAWFR